MKMKKVLEVLFTLWIVNFLWNLLNEIKELGKYAEK